MRTPAEKSYMVKAALAAEQSGEPLNRFCERMGWPHSSVFKYVQAYQREGDSALGNKRCNCGAKPRFEMDADEAAALRYMVLEYRGVPLAVERFAKSAKCRPETRERIFAEMDLAAREGRPPRWPISLRKAARVTEEMKAHHKGPKHTQNETEFSSRKVKLVRTEDGELRPMMVNEVFQSDDYSTNCPYIVVCPFTGQTSVNRQMLATVDEYTNGWRSYEPVGRERDAYRAEDIARHMLRTVDAAGTLPAVWILERGRWENNLIDGVPVTVNGLERRWGGLNALFQIKRAFKSRNKAEVEGGFNLLQAQLDPEGLSVGRWRGEREEATKLMTKIHNRAKHWTARELQDLGLWTMEACADMHAKIAGELNRRPKQRRGLGYVSAEDLAAKSPRFENPLQDCDRWRFCAVKREATVRRAHVECQVKGYEMPFRFVINGIADDVHLDHGYKVLVAFDPLAPEQGCHVFNNETGARNYKNLPWASFLLLAQYEGIIPALDYTGGNREDMEPRRKAAQAARSEYRQVAEIGRAAMSVSQAGDGRGNVITLERSGECGVRNAECGVEEVPERATRNAQPANPSEGRASRVASSLEKRLERERAKRETFNVCV